MGFMTYFGLFLLVAGGATIGLTFIPGLQCDDSKCQQWGYMLMSGALGTVFGMMFLWKGLTAPSEKK